MRFPIPFGPYLLLERIGVGGMAEVFKATTRAEPGRERLVALKRVLPAMEGDEEFIAMFVDEMKNAKQLSHPNIASILDVGIAANSHYIAMEYVDGRDLRSVLDQAQQAGRRLPVGLACFVVMKICEALDYAHRKEGSDGESLGLVHRDVTPQNILLSFDGEVKLIDFGLAKAKDNTSKTRTGYLKGKFAYMSPEQVRNRPVDGRSDLFAVGIVLYECLTGTQPFVADNDYNTLQNIRRSEVPPPTFFHPLVPPELEAIVFKALQKEPDQRFSSAGEMRDAIQEVMYASGQFFSSRDLSAHMREAFQKPSKSRFDSKYSVRPDAPVRMGDATPGPETWQRRSNLPAPSTEPGTGQAKVTAPAAGGTTPAASAKAGTGAAAPAASRDVGDAATAAAFGSTASPPPDRARQTGAAQSAGRGEWTNEDDAVTSVYDRDRIARAFRKARAMGATSPVIERAIAETGGDGVPEQPASTRTGGAATSPSTATQAQAASAGTPEVGVHAHATGGARTPAVAAPSPLAPAPGAMPTPASTTLPGVTAAQRLTPEAGRSFIAWVLVAAGLLLLAGVWLWYVFQRPGTITLSTSPPNAVVELDGKTIQSGGSPFVLSRIDPGAHTIVVSADDYRP
ncbi:MAG: protein kinase, partial [Myxococcales bacterium]|nr:protein kinase [Myxococcales bacterium]